MSREAVGLFRSRPVAGLPDPEALHRLGASLHREARLEESAEALAHAVRLAPRNPRYRISLAATLGRLGRHHEAIGEQPRQTWLVIPIGCVSFAGRCGTGCWHRP